ncbi:32775_t:CDS:2, partial [Racocetra persica]
RKWGVPIPILYQNNEPILNSEIIDYVAEIVAEQETFLGQDIMDVWLDSGCHKEISCGEKITIKEKVVFCKECSQKATAMCHGCSLPIFKHELVYEVSEG